MTLTKGDLKLIDKLIDGQKKDILGEVDSKLQTQKQEIFDEMDIKLQNLKSDFFERIDPVLKEVVIARDERPLIIDRIQKLERIHPNNKHVVTS